MINPQHPVTDHRRKFYKHLTRNIFIGLFLILASLFVGMVGYHHYEKMAWIDAYVNAAMILSGMGPLGELKTYEGKLFAGTYALFSGVFFLVVIGIVFLPVFRRFFKQIHLEEDIK